MLWTSALLAPSARAESVAGVCPDGSAFVVARKEDAPCPSPKFIQASDLPPLRPQYVPRGYIWSIDQQERDPNNPYNLVDRARAMRELKNGQQPGGETAGIGAQERTGVAATPSAAVATGSTRPASDPTPSFVLPDDELRDLVRLIALRQEVAPATLPIDDARGAGLLEIRYAYSPAFEARAHTALGLDPERTRVLLFSARSDAATEFYPRFFVVQDSVSFRPDPDKRSELGFVLGMPGAMEPGLLSIGYLVVPRRFDPAQSLTVWWNDRRLDVTLEPQPQPQG